MASELIFYRVNHLNQTGRQQEKKHVGAFPTDLSWIVSGGRAEPTTWLSNTQSSRGSTATIDSNDS